MLYMALSLALTASGILLAYLLLQTRPADGKTMNAVLSEQAFGTWTLGGLPGGYWLVLLTLIEVEQPRQFLLDLLLRFRSR